MLQNHAPSNSNLSSATDSAVSSIPPVAPAQARAVPRIDSRGLLRGHRELVIEHVGLEYRLQLTRNGKLILTK